MHSNSKVVRKNKKTLHEFLKIWYCLKYYKKVYQVQSSSLIVVNSCRRHTKGLCRIKALMQQPITTPENYFIMQVITFVFLTYAKYICNILHVETYHMKNCAINAF